MCLQGMNPCNVPSLRLRHHRFKFDVVRMAIDLGLSAFNTEASNTRCPFTVSINSGSHEKLYPLDKVNSAPTVSFWDGFLDLDLPDATG